MENEIFVPHSEQEKHNCEALRAYLDSMFFC